MTDSMMCPYCGYREVIKHSDNTITCVRCLRRYDVKLYKEKDHLYEQEIWLPVKDYENLYEVSNYMRVRRVSHYTHGRHIYGRILTPYLKKTDALAEFSKTISFTFLHLSSIKSISILKYYAIIILYIKISHSR